MGLLRAPLGAPRGELPEPLHARHAARRRSADRPRRSLVPRLAAPRIERMSTVPKGADPAVGGTFYESFGDVAGAVESGAGLPEVARATNRALNASLAVVDGSGSVLAVACASPDDERAVLSRASGTQALELRIGDVEVGQLRYRPRGELPPPALLRMVATLMALAVERARGPERASEAATAGFLRDVLDRSVTDREHIVARGNELGADLSAGASVIVVRAHPNVPEEGDWRARVLGVIERGARASAAGVELVASVELQRPGPSSPDGEFVVLLAGDDPDRARRTAESLLRELDLGLGSYTVAVAY